MVGVSLSIPKDEMLKCITRNLFIMHIYYAFHWEVVPQDVAKQNKHLQDIQWVNKQYVDWIDTNNNAWPETCA